MDYAMKKSVVRSKVIADSGGVNNAAEAAEGKAMTTASMINAYKKATATEVKLRKEADESGRLRASILANLAESGMSYSEIADAVGLSRPRTQQLIGKGKRANGTYKPRGAKKVAKKAAAKKSASTTRKASVKAA